MLLTLLSRACCAGGTQSQEAATTRSHRSGGLPVTAAGTSPGGPGAASPPRTQSPATHRCVSIVSKGAGTLYLPLQTLSFCRHCPHAGVLKVTDAISDLCGRFRCQPAKWHLAGRRVSSSLGVPPGAVTTCLCPSGASREATNRRYMYDRYTCVHMSYVGHTGLICNIRTSYNVTQ